MLPLTVAELSKQKSRSGFDEGHQNSAKQRRGGSGWTPVSSWSSWLPRAMHSLGPQLLIHPKQLSVPDWGSGEIMEPRPGSPKLET